MSNVSLLAAGFSQIIGAPVRTVGELQEEMKERYDEDYHHSVRGSTVSVNQLFNLTYGVFADDEQNDAFEDDEQNSAQQGDAQFSKIEYSCSSVTENTCNQSKRCCFIKYADGRTINVSFLPSTSVLKLNRVIKSRMRIPINIRVMHNGQMLRDGYTMECVRNDDVIEVYPEMVGGGGPLLLDDDLLAPDFDYDFTDKEDDGQVFKRGGYVYKRPYGWRRLALKVHGKPEYGDDTWLGKPGFRTRSSRGEWPVSYHGTKITSANDIVKEGFKDECLKRQLHGKGHYSSPDIDIAEQFAESFTYEGDQYKMVLQNRINMSGTVVIPRKATKDMGEYYVTHQSLDIRPYGILIKKI